VRRALLRVLGAVAALGLAGYCAALGYLFVFQRDFVFVPGGALTAPEAEGLAGVQVITLTAADGTALTGWYAASAPGLPTLLYFHGNAGNFSERADRFEQVRASGFGLLAMSYRGYPGSGGQPSEAAIASDALEAFDWLAARTDSIVLHGESLGTGVASYVAAERPARAVILEAPYTATVDIAAETYPWVPVSLLMRDQFLSREHVTRIEEPLLIVHGTADARIPVEHGKRLHELAGEPKQIVLIEGARHNNLWGQGLWDIVLGFLAEHRVVAQPEAEVRRMPSLAGR
jgi:fermentation-respiration switch protein FrsA (DUF1100 family)